MAKALLLIALCLASVLVSEARPNKNPYVVEGRVLCDACCAGFETPKAKYIAGAEVVVECRDRKTGEIVYSKKGRTDSTGTYNILVDEDHGDQACDAALLSSSHPDCAKVSPGRERARVILTDGNGIASKKRFANAMLFQKDEAEAGCTEILKQYQMDEEDV